MSRSVKVRFVCVGPQRTGTTWVHEMLQQHPSLCLPQAVKETMFFDRRYERGLGWYSSYFECEKKKICGEVAPTYFDEPKVPERIHEVFPECEMIVTLRHPAERAFSLYLHHLKKGRVSRPFREAVEKKPRIITAGKYATHLPRWQSTFGKEQVHLLLLRDIKARPEVALNQLCDWIGVGVLQNPSRKNEKVNAAGMPRSSILARWMVSLASFLHTQGLHSMVKLGRRMGLKKLVYTGGDSEMPEISAKDRSWLIRKYEEDINFVEEETGQDLSRWRE